MPNENQQEWFEEEPNRIEAKGTFSKDQMTALLHALWQAVLKYPEPFFNFDIAIDGFTPKKPKKTVMLKKGTEEKP
jgi:hypothetical protein